MTRVFVLVGAFLALLFFATVGIAFKGHAATTCDLVADTTPAGSSYMRCSDNGGPVYRVTPRLAWDILNSDMVDAAAGDFNGSVRFYGDTATDIAWAQAQAAAGLKLAFGGHDKGNDDHSYAWVKAYAQALCPYVVGFSLPDEAFSSSDTSPALSQETMNDIARGFRDGCPGALVMGDFYEVSQVGWYNANADVIGYDAYPGYAGPNWGQEINIQAWTTDAIAFRQAVTASKPIWISWLAGWGSTEWELPVMTAQESKTVVLLGVALGFNGFIEFPWCVDDYACAPGQNLPDSSYHWAIATKVNALLKEPLLYANVSNNMTVAVNYNGAATADIKTVLKRKNTDYLLVAAQWKNGAKKDAAHFKGLTRKNLQFCFTGRTVTSVTNVETSANYPVTANCFVEPDIGRIGVATGFGGSTMYKIATQ